jgi:hypothetical protein
MRSAYCALRADMVKVLEDWEANGSMIVRSFGIILIILMLSCHTGRAGQLEDDLERMCGRAQGNLTKLSAKWWELHEGEINLLRGKIKLVEGDLRLLRLYNNGVTPEQLTLMRQLNDLNQKLLCERSLRYRLLLKLQKNLH